MGGSRSGSGGAGGGGGGVGGGVLYEMVIRADRPRERPELSRG